MPEPIDYRILLNLQTALRSISVNAGYHFDVAAVAVKLDPNQGVEALIEPGGLRPFIVLELKPERWSYETSRPARLKHVMPVTVHWIGISDPTVDESFLHTYLLGCADIEQAVAVDITRGGLAFDHRVVNRTLDVVLNGAQVWAMVDTEVAINRVYGKPNG